MLLNYNNELIDVEIIRTKRTTLCLAIKEDGTVIVRSPLFLSDAKIRELLEQKANWILTKRKEVRQHQRQKVKREYVTGATLPFMGREIAIEIVQSKKSKVELVEDIFDFSKQRMVIYTSKTDEESIQALLKKWYKKQSMDYLQKRVAYYAQKMNTTYTSISIKSRKKQWGSCDTQGNLTFSWRLIMATEEAIDYVVVHELCHRRHMDHSKQFWKAVEKELPDYKEREKWLNENSVNMTL